MSTWTGLSNCLLTINGGIFWDELSNSLTTMRCPSPGQRYHEDKSTDSEAMHFYQNGIWQERRLRWLDDNPVGVSPRSALGGHRRHFPFCGGVSKRNSDQSLRLQAGISRRAVKANKPALFRLSSTFLTSLQSRSVNVSSKTRCSYGDQLKIS